MYGDFAVKIVRLARVLDLIVYGALMAFIVWRIIIDKLLRLAVDVK